MSGRRRKWKQWPSSLPRKPPGPKFSVNNGQLRVTSSYTFPESVHVANTPLSLSLSVLCCWPTSGNIPCVKICFPQYFGITRRYIKNIGSFNFFKEKKTDFRAFFFYFLRPAFSHGRLGHPQSLEYFFFFSLRLLLLTHFGETPVCENLFPPIFWHN